MNFTLYTNNSRENPQNNTYPNEKMIDTEAELENAVKNDHVGVKFNDFRRSNANFGESNVIILDCDNDHTDNPDEFKTPDDVTKTFSDLSFAVVASRNHMKEKGSKSPRPRFHVYFEINSCTDLDAYQNKKKEIMKKFPWFDTHAQDAAHFFFGAENAEVLVWHDAENTVDETPESVTDDATDNDIILEGSRNTTMSHEAGKILKHYGDTDAAKRAFEDTAARCEPPLDEKELAAIWKSALKFYYEKIQASPKYVSQEVYEQYRNNPFLKPSDLSDLGEAKSFIAIAGDKLLYTDATDYLAYDGKIWVESQQKAVGLLEDFLNLQLQQAEEKKIEAEMACLRAGITNPNSMGNLSSNQKKLVSAKNAAKEYLKFVQSHRDMSGVKSTLEAAKHLVATDISKFDSQAFLLNTPNGTYDLMNPQAGPRPHNPEDLITKITKVSPGEKGKELWLQTLNQLFNSDTELIQYVQKIAGLSAIGQVYLEALIIAFGEGGNGKSTFWNAIKGVLGTYAGSISADVLTTQCRRNAKPELAELRGKRFATSSELEEGTRLNTAMLKQICSTDSIYAEKKYKDPFSFIPTHTLVLYTNHLPKVGANDQGTWRRLIVVPFMQKFEDSKDVKNYSKYLVDMAGPAILAWIIEGAHKVIDSNFNIKAPEAVEAANQKYQEDNNWLGDFLFDCCEVNKELTVPSGELYNKYHIYCTQNNEYIRSKSDFYAALEHKGFKKNATNRGRFVLGLGFKAPFSK